MERWVVFGAILTSALAAVATLLLPFTRMMNGFWLPVIPMWFLFLVAAPMLYGAYLALTGGLRWKSIDHGRVLTVCAGYWLLALNLSFFGWLKPQLGYLVPFANDLALAEFDHLILGADAWTLLGWFNHDWLPFLYHEGWFAWFALVLCVVVLRKPSSEKDQLLISYFAIWTLFGPVVHLAIPAAGPVFFDELGLGDRFAGLRQDAQSQRIASYLWDGFTSHEFNPGGGISAMPSIHLAIMAWTIIALRDPLWRGLAVAFTIYIFLGSIVLGWHYAIDGLVGLVGGWICYLACATRRIPNMPPTEQFASDKLK